MRKRVLSIVFIIALLDQLAFGIMVPLLPLLVIDAVTDSINYITLSLLFAAFPAAQLVAAPILGQLSDLYGRKKILILSLVLIFLGYLALIDGATQNLIGMLFIGRILTGVGAGAVSVLFAIIADSTTKENRSRGFGLIAAASGLGIILGPAIGGIFSNTHLFPQATLTTPLYLLLGFVVMNILLVLFVLPETIAGKAVAKLRILQSLFHLSHAYAGNIRILFVLFFLYMMSLTMFITYGSVLLFERFLLSQAMVSFFLVFFGISLAIVQLLFVPILSKRYTPKALLSVSMFGSFVFLALFAVVPAWEMILVLVPFIALTLGLSYTTLISLISVQTDATEQGHTMGITTSVQALGQFVPGLLTGFIAVTTSAAGPILVGACIFLGCAIVVRSTFGVEYKR